MPLILTYFYFLYNNPMPEQTRAAQDANNKSSKPFLTYRIKQYPVENKANTIHNHFKYFILIK